MSWVSGNPTHCEEPEGREARQGLSGSPSGAHSPRTAPDFPPEIPRASRDPKKGQKWAKNGPFLTPFFGGPGRAPEGQKRYISEGI